MKSIVVAVGRVVPVLFRKYTYAVLSVGLLLVIPMISHQQLVTGSLVNALLLLTSVFVGPVEAMMVGLVPSLAAVSTGTLPLVLAPAIPFIMMSNAVYIYSFFHLKKRSVVAAAVAAALIKYSFLYFSTHVLLSRLLQEAILNKVIIMMGWPQLLTALIGGVITVLVVGRKS